MTASKILSAALCVTMTGCATVSPAEFYANRQSYSDLQVCSLWRQYDNEVGAGAESEAERRGISVEQCRAMLDRETQANATAVGAAMVALLLIGAAAKGGGRPSAPITYSGAAADREWDWDQFYNPQYVLVWGCRGVQTGQFADESQCIGRAKTDMRWPGPYAPTIK